MIFYNYSFRFLDSQGKQYLLRKSEITAAKVLYRTSGTTDSFTQTLDYNIDEKNNTLWVRLPTGELELVFTLNVQPLRTLTTGLQVLKFSNTTTAFDLTATPVPLNSLQGYSPRIIGGYWYEYDDDNQAFYNTGIAAAGTVISETTQVDDFLQLGDVNPVTSNAVKKETDELSEKIAKNTTQIEQHDTALRTLKTHKISVTLNDTTTEEDTNGNINIGENISAGKLTINTEEGKEITTAKENEDGVIGKICLGDGAILLNGDIVGGRYGRHLTCYNSPTLAYELTVSNMNNPSSIYIEIVFYSQKIAGNIFICKENFNTKIYCDNPLLTEFIYKYGDGIIYYNPASGGMTTGIYIYSTDFKGILEDPINYAGDVNILQKILYGIGAKSWSEIYSTPFIIDSLTGELDLSVNIPAISLTLPADLEYPQTIVVKNIQGAVCTLSSTGYTDLTLDDQTINYITLTSSSEWSNVSTKNDAGAQGVKYVGDSTIYPVNAQGIIELPAPISADGNTVSVQLEKYRDIAAINGTHYIVYSLMHYDGVYIINFTGNSPTFTVTLPKEGETVLLNINDLTVYSTTKRADAYIVNGALVGYYEYLTATDVGDVSAPGGLSVNKIAYAFGNKKIATMDLTKDKLLKDLDILYSLLYGTLTYQCDRYTVTNGVTKAANKMVTTAYNVTSIGTNATMDIQHGNPFLINSDAAKQVWQLRLDDADMTDADSHKGWIAGSTQLQLVTLPSTAYAFSYAEFFKDCTNLIDVSVSPGGLKLITSMFRIFAGCPNGPVRFCGGEPCAATSWGGAFANSGVTFIGLAGSGCSALTTMSRFALNCSSLITLNLMDFNFGTAKCDDMLSGCTSLKNFSISGAKMAGICNCYQMFCNCSSLVRLSFGTSPMFTTSVNCGGMFKGCSALTHLDISAFNFSNISSCYKMLSNCTAITSLTLPTGWNLTLDLGWQKNIAQSSILAISEELATGVADKAITFDATIYAAIPATVISTITDKGWTISTVTYL